MICITGAHRSGTSMVTRLLNLTGVYLGPDFELLQPADDNPEGFWENVLFINLNNALLQHLGGTWHTPPPFEPGWQQRPDCQHFRGMAQALIERFAAQPVWGWKDPRSALTLPFWKELLPGLKVVVCLRSPHDVARSLKARGEHFSFLDLWLRHNQIVMENTRPEDRLVTHFDAYFHDPAAELGRVLDWLGLPARGPGFEQALATIRKPLRHHETALPELLGEAHAGVLACYMQLCSEAGPVYADYATGQQLEIAGRPFTITTTPQAPLGYQDARLLRELGEDRARLEVECRELSDKLAAANEHLHDLHQRLAAAHRELHGVASSRAWQWLQKLSWLLRPFRRPPRPDEPT